MKQSERILQLENKIDEMNQHMEIIQKQVNALIVQQAQATLKFAKDIKACEVEKEVIQILKEFEKEYKDD